MIGSRSATMAVDWEQRVDFARLRTDRLERARDALERSELGAVLLFDQNNIRYVTSTHIGEWARDKSARCVLLPRGGDPVLWDFGSAAKHHQLYAPWLPGVELAAGVSSMRGAMPRETGVPDCWRPHLRGSCASTGSSDEPLGIDLTDMETLASLHRTPALPTADAQPVMLSARRIKTEDEIALLDHAAGDRRRGLRADLPPAASGRPRARDRRRGAAAAVRARLRAGRGDQRRLRRPLQPPSACLLRPPAAPGDQAFFDIIHSFMGYRTCYYRTFCVGGASPVPARRLQAVPRMAGPGDRARPARHDDRPDRGASGRPPRNSASPTRRHASACSSGTGSASGSTSRR